MYLNCLCQIKGHGTVNGRKKVNALSGRMTKGKFQKKFGIKTFITDGTMVGLHACRLGNARQMKQENLKGNQKDFADTTG